MSKASGLLAIVVLGAAGVAAAPWVDGYLFKTDYTNLIEAFNKDSANDMTITQYNQGWLYSDVVLTKRLMAKSLMTGAPVMMTINQHISHGPLIKDPTTGSWLFAKALIESQVHLDKNVEALLGAAVTNGILQQTTQVSFANQYNSQLKIPMLAYAFQNVKINIQGADGHVDLDTKHDQVSGVSGALTMKPLTVAMDDNTLTIPSMSLSWNQNCRNHPVCEGDTTFSIPTASAQLSGKTSSINNYIYKVTYGLKGPNTFGLNVDMSLDKLTLPDYAVNKLHGTFALNNVNSDAFDQILKKVKAFQQKVATGSATDSDKLIFIAEANKNVLGLIAATTSIDQTAKMDTDFGRFQSTLHVNWPNNVPLPADTRDLAKATVKVDVQAATTLVDHVIKSLDESSHANGVAANSAIATPVAAAPVVVPPNPNDVMKKIITPYVLTHKMSMSVANELMSLQSQHLSPVIYNSAVDKIMLKQSLPKIELAKVSKALKDNYAATYSEDDTLTPAPGAPAPVAQQPAVAAAGSMQPSATPAAEGDLQKRFDALIQQGFVKQQQDSYISSLVYENGTLKVNGIPVPIPDPATIGTPSAE